MTVSFEFKALNGCDPVIEHYIEIDMCRYYFSHGRIYLKLYKNTSEVCIDLSGVKSFLIDD